MQRTIIDQIEITSDGDIHVRMKKQIVDGDNVYDLGFHRTSIECGGDCDAQMNAVNTHLGAMKMGMVKQVEIDEIKKHATIAFTPERIKAQNDKKDIALASMLASKEITKRGG